MHQLILAQEKKYLKNDLPRLKSGQTVKVYEKIKEGEKFRTQVFQGLIISSRNKGNLRTNITVRKIVEGIGVEKIFPVHSKMIEKIEVIREAKVRQANIKYMRKLTGKAVKLKGSFVSNLKKKEVAKADELTVPEETPEVKNETEIIEAENTPEEVKTTEEKTPA